MKLSEQAVKVSNPGIQQVRRFQDRNGFVADVIYDLEAGLPEVVTFVDPADPNRRRRLDPDLLGVDLLTPVFRQGRKVAESVPLADIRQRTLRQLARFPAGVRRFLHPHAYPVGLELGLHNLKTQLILQARERNA